MHHLEPLSIFLVKKGGAGDRVLLRYPYSEPPKTNEELLDFFNPYALQDLPEDLANLQTSDQELGRLNEKNLIKFPSKVLSNLFAASKQLCNQQKFELKVDDIRFVGHPVNLEMKPEEARYYVRYQNGQAEKNLSMFHIVFALSTSATYSVVKCYHDLSQQLAAGIRYEERWD